MTWQDVLDGIKAVTVAALIGLGLGMVILMFTGCSTLGSKPPPPKGQFCAHNQPEKIAQCADLQNGHATPAVPIDQTDRWIMFSPETWENIQNYIDALKRAIDNQSAAPTSVTPQSQGGVYIRARDVEAVQNRMLWLREQVEVQR